ncbi:mini-chromosome maintenance complex-binding protein [Cimex lectularius]|uniref:Mini-chromosome maintenance complex-binding protein n=1 Tax=Cimex lectularius TaxID=79782 RepID=A0A8I6S5G7_CIMLE|nr:mini-chromosome maintenance complex-binding protein [Cimex lectularius]
MWQITVESYKSNLENSLKYINDNWDKIQLIRTPSDIVEGQIYKFRGMVQDMLDPIYFYATYEVRNTATGETQQRCGKYVDFLDCVEGEELIMDSANCVNAQRKPYYCITIPGLNNWAQLNPNQEKILPAESSSNLVPEKRNIEAMETDEEHDSKRYRTDRGHSKLSGPAEKSYPIPDPTNMSCIVHFYEDIPQNIKVTDTIEVVGFAYRNEIPQDDADDPPVRNIPRLHAVAFRELKTSNPLYTETTNSDEVLSEAKALRSELHLVLSQLFLGDHLAADFFICYLLARIYKRQDCLALGKMSMNLFNIPMNNGLSYPHHLYRVLEKLVPKSYLFPMTLRNMNTTNMSPRKNYDLDRLESGLLQLSSQTHLVIDETKLETGKLEEKGVQNFKTMMYIISQQKINYDFKYYSIEFDTDIPILILSEGKSALPSDCKVSLKPDPSCSVTTEVFDSILMYLQEPLLSKLRLYLTVASMADFELPEDLLQLIQDDFVKLRQRFNATADDLHNLIILARWTSLSYGEKKLTREMWEKVGKMDLARRERLT